MNDDEDLTLPGGWRWASSIHDQSRGIALSKVWWRNAKPFIRVKLYVVGSVSGRAEGAIRGTIEVALAKREFDGPSRKGHKRVKHTMHWGYVMDIPELPSEPTAAAVSVEFDYPVLSHTIRHHVSNLLWCETEA